MDYLYCLIIAILVLSSTLITHAADCNTIPRNNATVSGANVLSMNYTCPPGMWVNLQCSISVYSQNNIPISVNLRDITNTTSLGFGSIIGWGSGSGQTFPTNIMILDIRCTNFAFDCLVSYTFMGTLTCVNPSPPGIILTTYGDRECKNPIGSSAETKNNSCTYNTPILGSYIISSDTLGVATFSAFCSGYQCTNCMITNSSGQIGSCITQGFPNGSVRLQYASSSNITSPTTTQPSTTSPTPTQPSTIAPTTTQPSTTAPTTTQPSTITPTTQTPTTQTPTANQEPPKTQECKGNTINIIFADILRGMR